MYNNFRVGTFSSYYNYNRKNNNNNNNRRSINYKVYNWISCSNNDNRKRRRIWSSNWINYYNNNFYNNSGNRRINCNSEIQFRNWNSSRIQNRIDFGKIPPGSMRNI